MRRILVGADPSRVLSASQAYPIIDQLPSVRNLPEGVQRLNLGPGEVAGRVDQELHCRGDRRSRPRVRGAGAALSALPRSLREHGLAAARAAWSSGRAPPGWIVGVASGFHRAADAPRIVAKNSILLVDFAVEMMNHGMPKDEAIYEAGHKRAADRHDIGCDGRGHVADRLLASRRQQLARADGHQRDWRPHFLDHPDAGAGARLFLHRDRHRAVGRPQARALRGTAREDSPDALQAPRTLPASIDFASGAAPLCPGQP